MKKKLLVVAMFIVVIMTTCLLAGCNTPKMTLGFMTSADGTPSYVDVNIKDYDGKMLVDLLKADLSLEVEFDEYEMVAKIKGLKPEPNQYICIFTSDESKKNSWEGAEKPIEKDGITYYQSGFGVKDLPVNENVKYMFVILENNW